MDARFDDVTSGDQTCNFSRHFAVTGFGADVKAELVLKLTALGGIYHEYEHIDSGCTHLICNQPSRSKKFLGACACGKWILAQSYICDSYNEGKWLPESKYELSECLDTQREQNIPLFMYLAPKKCRLITETTGSGVFCGWVATIISKDLRRASSYKKILKLGGCKIKTVSLPIKDAQTLPEEITHYFVESDCLKLVKALIRSEKLCLSTDYIRNFLLLDPPPEPEAFSLASYEPNSDAVVSSTVRMKHRSKKLVPMVKRTKCNEPSTSRHRKKSCNSSDAQEGTTSVSSKTSIGAAKNVKIASNKKKVLSGKTNRAAKELSPSSQPLIRDLFGSRPVIDLSSENEKPVETMTRRRKMPLIDLPLSVASPENKKASDGLVTENSSKESLPFSSAYLGQKYYTDENSHTTDVVREVSSTLSSMFEASMEEGETGAAIDLMASVLFEGYPPASAINSLITSILMCDNANSSVLVRKASSFFLHLRCLYPPTSLTTKCLYLQALCWKKSAWETITEIIQISLSRASSCFLLSFVINLLEKNFSYFVTKRKNASEEMEKSSSNLLILDVFWKRIDKGTVNNNCLELLEFFAKAIECDAHEVEALLSRLISVVGDCLMLTDRNFVEDYSLSSCAAFSEMLFTVCSDLALSSMDHLQRCLFSLNPSWLRCDFAKHLLVHFASSTFSIADKACENLEDIVKSYMDLKSQLPQAHEVKSRSEFNSRIAYGRSRIRPETVNKQNCKGETALHRACAENRVNYLKRLLYVPGIDVNMRDNAGWTSLHEACNHGNVDCVNILLRWSHSIKDDTSDTMGVDVCAANSDGITALHDAVINNHVNVAKALLKYGGLQLLKLKTSTGYTALDLAASKEMAFFLSSYAPNGPQTPVTPKKLRHVSSSGHVSHEDCCKYLLIIGHFLDSYFHKNRIKEVAMHLSELSACASEKDVFSVVRSILSTSAKKSPTAKEIAAFSDDLYVFWDMETHLQNLEASLESIVGRKNCFKSEITFLECVCLVQT